MIEQTGRESFGQVVAIAHGDSHQLGGRATLQRVGKGMVGDVDRRHQRDLLLDQPGDSAARNASVGYGTQEPQPRAFLDDFVTLP